ncbi:RidA family protein [Burkholderia sp. Bp9142]|uniref:RidA family protein n=1 Tax=Burkholderia sp. Bp9142 TaxID=2184573 RepID=UPI000F5A9D10|nr:RidA family protein [Burkholderia sp. Bp9142]RQR23274.1 RidA family protein [Burkholderia sp. Bp9142]
MTTIAGRLSALSIDLPTVPAPVGSYASYYRSGNLLFLSGQGARNADGTLRKGRLGDGYTTEQGYDDARRIGLQLLATVQNAIGDLENIRGVVKILGMVQATPDFKDHPKVIDGCSNLFLEVLGERGRHARSAVGMASLPAGLSVEIEAVFEIVSST